MHYLWLYDLQNPTFLLTRYTADLLNKLVCCVVRVSIEKERGHFRVLLICFCFCQQVTVPLCYTCITTDRHFLLKIMTQENNQPPALADADQQQPLLQSPEAQHDDSDSKRAAYKVIKQCFIINACMEISGYLISIPLNPILESIICRNAFADISGDADPRCKSSLVQGELSFIRGWQLTFDFVPGMLTAMPYTLMANKYGRPYILLLAVVGGSLASSFIVLICILFLPKGCRGTC